MRYVSEEMGLQFSRPVNIENIDENHIIIAVVGQTGVGKSTFINSAVGRDILPVGRTLKPETREIQHVESTITRKDKQKRVIFVEAPGFDSEKEDRVEKKLRSWLGKVSSKKLRIFAILYLHRVTDERLPSPPALHLTMIKTLCEQSITSFPTRVVLVTTMWGMLKERERAEAREQVLQKYWDNMPWTTVSQVMRFDGSRKNAEIIMNDLMEGDSEEDGMDKETINKTRQPKEKERERDNEGDSPRISRDNLSDLISQLVGISKARSFPACLQDAEAQSITDFLNKILDDPKVLAPDERKHALHLLSKLIKSAQAFPRCFELAGVECDLDGIPFTRGEFGCIYKGHYQTQAICVKVVQVTEDQSVGVKALTAQAGELVSWAHLSHPNVLPFYGGYFSLEEIPRICLVSPWMEHGHLTRYLKKNPKRSRIPLFLDVVSGLKYLHESGIVHGDLKAANVLVSGTERAVLTNFGISRVPMTTTSATGTPNWMAPELLTAKDDDTLPTFASDMWSFGCTCYEVMTGKIPFHRHKNPINLIKVFMKTQGRYTPLQVDPEKRQDGYEVWRVAERCWDPNPDGRPTAEEAQQSLIALAVKDDRPSFEADSARFLQAKRARQNLVEIDYDHVHSILQIAQVD